MQQTTEFELQIHGHKVIYKSIGFTSKELSLPKIAVINSWSEQSPGHSHLREVTPLVMKLKNILIKAA
jgi:dihydroxyacid dehydratase/phosphogluconate dehydratase